MFKEHPHIAADFWNMLDRSGGEDACWPWIGGYKKGKYGCHRFYYPGTRWRVEAAAHRFAYELASGEPLSGEWVICHTCDNPLCCNPRHLWPGTIQENNTDRHIKGRNGRPTPDNLTIRNQKIKNALKTHHQANLGKYQGQNNPFSKLTDDIVRQIRALSAQGINGAEIARRLNVGHTTVLDIINRKRWTHIE